MMWSVKVKNYEYSNPKTFVRNAYSNTDSSRCPYLPPWPKWPYSSCMDNNIVALSSVLYFLIFAKYFIGCDAGTRLSIVEPVINIEG